MWHLPTELLPPLEKALARVEATFRGATRTLERRTWRAIHEAIRSAMLDSLKAYDEQAYLGVQQGRLTVSKAREGAEDFLTAQAHRLFDWLVPVMDRVYGSPFRFRRYESDDRFVFSRDTVEEVQSSEKWSAFLTRLAAEPVIASLLTPSAAAASAASDPDAAPSATHAPASSLPDMLPALDTEAERRKAMTAKLARVSQDTDEPLRQVDFLKAAKEYQDRKTLSNWLRHGPGAPSSPSAHQAFCRVLGLPSAEFVAACRQWTKRPKRASQKKSRAD